jgi:nucleoside-diphosphate-sugar epimerase
LRVLITGHRGYLGSVMASYLQQARFDVVGVDCDWYRDCDFGRMRESVPSFDTDLRDLEFTDLLSFDAVIHLAALPEDRERILGTRLTNEVNVNATIRLAEMCKQAQVGRFLFASTCAVYDSLNSHLIDETSPASPITDYARSKLRCEEALSKLADDDFSPIFLRLGTAYGVSPRLRLDTVVNEFTASAVAFGSIEARTAGRAWRPLLHVEDIARTFAAMLMAPEECVSREIINVVSTHENFRIIDVADAVTELIPSSRYTMNREVPDRRSYRVSGQKLNRVCPKLVFRWTLRDGIRQLRDALENAGLTPGEFRSSRYRRLNHLAELRERGELNATLRDASCLATSNI